VLNAPVQADDAKPSLFDHIAPPVPQAEDFVAVAGRRLTVRGANTRFWGMGLSLAEVAAGFAPQRAAGGAEAEAPAAATDAATAQRLLEKLHSLSCDLLLITDSPTGEHSGLLQEVVAQSRRYGIRIGLPGAASGLGCVFADDAAILDDPASREDWQASLPPDGLPLDDMLARVWDPRLELLGIQRLRENVRLMNGRSGLRLSDDPAVAYWELAAGEHWLEQMLAGEWQSLPLFQSRLLLQRWNAWLYARYETDAALVAAWGSLRPAHESLDNDTCLLTPLEEGLDIGAAQRILLGIALEDSDYPPVTCDLLSQARRDDVRLFLREIWQGHKEREELAFRRWGDSARSAPLLWHRKPAVALDQSGAGAVAYVATYGEVLQNGLRLPPEDKARPRLLHLMPESAKPAPISPEFFLSLVHQVDAVNLSGLIFWGLESFIRSESAPTATGVAEVMSRAGRFAFRNDITVPVFAGDEKMLKMEEPHLLVFRHGGLTQGEAVEFDGGIRFEWLIPAKKDDKKDASTVEPDAEAPDALETEAEPVLTKCAVSAALMSEDGSPFVRAPKVRLMVAARAATSQTPEKALDIQLALRADYLTGDHYVIYDSLGRELAQGTVEQMPFVVPLQQAALEIWFVNQ